MLGTRSEQTGLFAADTHYLQFVGEDSFYGFLAREGRRIFRDEDFARLYCLDNGRTSVPPSLLALALLLQTHDRVSDEEAKQRADFDIRWKVALGIEIDCHPFAKSTLQCFRAQLLIHDRARQVFGASLKYAKTLGYLKQGRRIRAALDTTHVLGRGAVQDTVNLIAEGIRILSRMAAELEETEWGSWLAAHELARYGAPSIKGASEVDWEKPGKRAAFLSGVIADGGRLLEIARGVRGRLETKSPADERLQQAADLLTKLLWQDVAPAAAGYQIKQGTAKDRIPSAHDPEQRHGRKSHGTRFTGHKAGIAVEVESQLITAVAVIAGNAGDGECAADLVTASEANTGEAVAQVIGDTAFGGMGVRESLGEREVIAPTVKPGGPSGRITKADFTIDLETGVVRCPMGQETRLWVRVKQGKTQQPREVVFETATCRACPRCAACVHSAGGRGRRITLHPQEAALQRARAFEQTTSFREQYRDRVVVEHRIARLVGLGMRQARYLGRAKTGLQLLLAATVANLTLLLGRGRCPEGASGAAGLLCSLREAGSSLLAALRGAYTPSAGSVRGSGVNAITPALQRRPFLRLLPTRLQPIRSPCFRPGF